MVRCFSCGGGWLLKVGDGVYRCQGCGQLNEVRPSGKVLPRRMEVYPRIEQVREAAVEGVYEMTAAVPSESGLSPDMVTWVRRIGEFLIPTEGYSREIKAKLLRTQRDIKRGLTDVLEGKRKFDDWFDETKSNLGKHPMEMNQILFNAAEGLSSPEAVQIRSDYGRVLEKGMFG